MADSTTYRAKPIITDLGVKFYDPVRAAVFPKAISRYTNFEAAQSVGLGDLTKSEWQRYFHAFEALPDNLVSPLALRYHGHQFQSYNDQLGDGRGFLAAQLLDADDRILDLGTKGSGQTPWSRSGDGRLTLKGAVREALATEMLQSLGVKTSKTFCFFETGEHLERNDEPSPTRAAVLTRLGHSHIRFGTFQRQAALRDNEALRSLADYVIRHYYPEVGQLERSKQVPELLKQVTVKTAELCASWMIAGFVHGVLNTDNMNINGESFDYGPFRFLPTFNPEFTAAYFDHSGLYAYGRQPEAVVWNLEQLASCFLIIHEDRDSLVAALQAFTPSFNAAAARLMRERFGLAASETHSDDDLLLAAFNFLGESQITFEQFFFDWYGAKASEARSLISPEAEKYSGEAFTAFKTLIADWPLEQGMMAALSGPYFRREKPCTLLIDEIEAIWAPIAASDDWTSFESKIEDIRTMGQAHGRR